MSLVCFIADSMLVAALAMGIEPEYFPLLLDSTVDK
jgi:hypothetical protein